MVEGFSRRSRPFSSLATWRRAFPRCRRFRRHCNLCHLDTCERAEQSATTAKFRQRAGVSEWIHIELRHPHLLRERTSGLVFFSSRQNRDKGRRRRAWRMLIADWAEQQRVKYQQHVPLWNPLFWHYPFTPYLYAHIYYLHLSQNIAIFSQIF